MTMLAELALADIHKPASEKRDKKIRDTVEEILNQGQLCSRIIKKMKSPDKNISVDFKSIDINPVIIQAVNKARYYGYDDNTTIRQNLENNIPEIKADPDAILQLVTNLISNAFDSMKNSAKKILTITSNKNGEGITIKVTDTGCGIDKARSKKIFNSYYTTKGENGTGLGLSICKTIVNNHHGTITVNSSRNLGTQFNIFLPFDCEY